MHDKFWGFYFEYLSILVSVSFWRQRVFGGSAHSGRHKAASATSDRICRHPLVVGQLLQEVRVQADAWLTSRGRTCWRHGEVGG